MNLQHTPSKLISLQVLRAIAALMVAIGHLQSIDARFFGGPVLSPLVHMGFAGVDLFFVISGFVMIYITYGNIGRGGG